MQCMSLFDLIYNLGKFNEPDLLTGAILTVAQIEFKNNKKSHRNDSCILLPLFKL